jgi:hypothetical protein
MYFVTLRGEAAYYVRRIAFVIWIILGCTFLASGESSAVIWGVIMIMLGIFGIAKFGLRRYPHH